MGKLITFVVAIVAVIFWVTVIFVWLSAHHLDTTPFVLFLGTIVGTGIPSIINLWNSFALHETTKQTQEQVTKIEENTNGSMTQQFQEVKDKIEQLGPDVK